VFDNHVDDLQAHYAMLQVSYSLTCYIVFLFLIIQFSMFDIIFLVISWKCVATVSLIENVLKYVP
jgi:hypothetical protein